MVNHRATSSKIYTQNLSAIALQQNKSQQKIHTVWKKGVDFQWGVKDFGTAGILHHFFPAYEVFMGVHVALDPYFREYNRTEVRSY